MDRVSLMKRTDTKFILHKNQLPGLLETIKDSYKILEIDGGRMMTYTSLYFDTAGKKFYLDHHNGKVNRTKVRMRKYIESGKCFLEIKQKDGKGRTHKSRIPINEIAEDLSKKSRAFIKEITQESFDLRPTIWNKFNRMTLVHKTAKERLTIDLNLCFSLQESLEHYTDLAIIEVKQERFNRKSPVVKTLKETGIYPFNISKYCMGMLRINEGLKYNRFKQKVLKINKLTA